jgi:hypothetical protein
LLGVVLAGVTVTVLDAGAGHTAAVPAGSCTFAGLLGCRIILPLAIRHSGRSKNQEAIPSNGLHTN